MAGCETQFDASDVHAPDVELLASCASNRVDQPMNAAEPDEELDDADDVEDDEDDEDLDEDDLDEDEDEDEAEEEDVDE